MNAFDAKRRGFQNELEAAGVRGYAPATFDVYAFGEVETAVSYYTCRGISGTGDQVRTITGLEYNVDVFDDVIVDIPVTVIPPDSLIDNVDFLGFTVSLKKFETDFRYVIDARFSSDNAGYAYSEIWVRFNGLAWNTNQD